MRNSEPLHSTRRSRPFYTDAIPDPELRATLRAAWPERTGYPWMFCEDVENGLLPWPNHHPFQAVLVGEGADLLTTTLTAGSRGARSLTRATHDLMRQAMPVILNSQVATFEVELLASGEGQDPKEIRVHLLHPGSVEWRSGRPVQLLPVEWEPAGFVDLDPALLLELRIPGLLATRVRDTLHFLGTVEESDRSEFALIEQSYSRPTAFAADVFHRIRRRLLVAGTAGIAWDARGSFVEEVLDPYSVARALRFLRFKIQLRDALLTQINEYLQRSAHRLAATVRLEFRNVPTEADVDAAEAALQAGTEQLSTLIALAVDQQIIGTAADA